MNTSVSDPMQNIHESPSMKLERNLPKPTNLMNPWFISTNDVPYLNPFIKGWTFCSFGSDTKCYAHAPQLPGVNTLMAATANTVDSRYLIPQQPELPNFGIQNSWRTNLGYASYQNDEMISMLSTGAEKFKIKQRLLSKYKCKVEKKKNQEGALPLSIPACMKDVTNSSQEPGVSLTTSECMKVKSHTGVSTATDTIHKREIWTNTSCYTQSQILIPEGAICETTEESSILKNIT
eukprot:CAMPEP_0197000116 /NCGR_PEP_ID=MMETSP1380-20130617/5148_1 /TAXON_ID=5936 /ORGANISM="Euplotes crassus, Strain CT5" /LENGTH=234 /DNA_ID=CAMNT_0042417301 /DNA_START=31 /DNA_END=736 /DNA_ORIENTATION=+